MVDVPLRISARMLILNVYVLKRPYFKMDAKIPLSMEESKGAKIPCTVKSHCGQWHFVLN